MTHQTDDLHIKAIQKVVSPDAVHTDFPSTETSRDTIYEARQAVHKILQGEDDRLLVIVGPCSIHDPKAALAYASQLIRVRDALKDDLLIIMRVYFEKPRTTIGWKGLINDPDLDNSFHINKGLRVARELLVNINDMGMPTGSELLDLITPQYIADLISWGAIGARTTESQVHRELASGLSAPVGFKNGTDGTLSIAIDAIGAASKPHHFLSLTKAGHSAIFSTTGNVDCHIILRGGKKPNYDAKHVEQASCELEAAGRPAKLMIDFSHANSNKDYQRQLVVGADVAGQIAGGDERIIGTMIESHLKPGRQESSPGGKLEYGISITDACLGWPESEQLLKDLARAVQQRRLAGKQEKAAS